MATKIRPAVLLGAPTQPSPAQALEAVKSDIRELHTRANELRLAIGQPAAADIEPVLGRYGASSDSAQLQVASQALSQLRDQKAGELQILTLYECGRSVRDCRAAATHRLSQSRRCAGSQPSNR